MKPLLRRAGYLAVKTAVFTLRPIPLPLALLLGRALGNLMRLVSRRRYEVAISNLGIAYGDTLPASRKTWIARECFRQFGMFAIESIKLPFLSDREIDAVYRMGEADQATLETHLSRGRGCLLVTGHLGSFEIAGRWLAQRGKSVYSIMRETRDPALTRLIRELRARNGIRAFNTDTSLRAILRALKQGASIAIVCDQNAGDIFVPFFGRRTGTVVGPARLALASGAPILIGATFRRRGRYESRIVRIVEADRTAELEREIERIMTEIAAGLEEAIRSQPEQWLWYHDRWRSVRQETEAASIPLMTQPELTGPKAE